MSTLPFHRHIVILFMPPRPPRSTLFPYTTLFRSVTGAHHGVADQHVTLHNPIELRERHIDRQHACVNLSGRSLDFHLRSEEHTSELQSHSDLVCRLLLEKKKKQQNRN